MAVWAAKGENFCKCFSFLKTTDNLGHTVEGVLDFFFEDAKGNFNLAQLKQEVESWKIKCSAESLFKHLDSNSDFLVGRNEMANYFTNCKWESNTAGTDRIEL